MSPRHIGRGPGFINEDQPLRVEVELAVKPVLSQLHNIGAILLRRMGGLFYV